MIQNGTKRSGAIREHSVAEISEVLDLSTASVRNKLAGRRRWQVAELKKLADAWGTTVDALIGRSHAGAGDQR
ncbi:hypothetical protein FAM15407_001477 [Propionibacterium freudenreichii]|uniref:helix-turn-helix domain-containing protein n=1 Tax=Propionibacterium freudenreichii TaxID=1744 RepID=UPI002434287B|nr:helix-turn-helix domain-containing protein [Propionibacterium freudenreichii]MDK9657899.1 hypothetical protein [Propionibacterium freudenreichii]WFF31052.1 hypothetical protein FAM19024_000240 [Propionibacterium freudenreichii]